MKKAMGKPAVKAETETISDESCEDENEDPFLMSDGNASHVC